MYGFITHTWNPVKGECQHNCAYCYMKRFPQRQLRLVEKELEDDLGEGHFIFVGSSTDLFAKDVPNEWIRATLQHCKNYPKNKYLFQSKNPTRFIDFKEDYPHDVVFGTTIETNDTAYLASISRAPNPYDRAQAIKALRESGYETMITIEPIIEFDLPAFTALLADARPNKIAIGADSNSRHSLREPNKEKTLALIQTLRLFTEVYLKPNLDRVTK